MAAKLARPLGALVRRARDRGEALEEDLLATVRAIEAAGREYSAERERGSVSGTVPGKAHPGDVKLEPMTSTEAAEVLGCGRRNVTKLAGAGALGKSRLAGGTWIIDGSAVRARARRRR